MTDKKNTGTSDEKRRFFRIEDLVHMTCNVLDEQVFQEKIELLDKGVSEQFLILSDLAAISSEMAATLRKIEVVSPDVAEYLKSLDLKIDILGRALMTEELDVSIDAAVPVNLSAAGVGITISRPMPVDSNVEVKMILLPDHIGIIALGRVVGTSECDDGKFLIRIDFTHLRDTDRDVLIRHIMRKQGEMLRERRMSREAD